jgi:hypothetical protein
MKNLTKYWPQLLATSLFAVCLIILYCIIFYYMGVLPLGGKKAPSFVLVLILQYLLVKKVFKTDAAHFLIIFLFQYIYILLIAIFSSLVLYFFYLSEVGLGVLNEYIQLSISELQMFKSVIIEQEGIEYYKMLLNGINGIDAGSIAKDDFSQKIVLAFLPNLLMSLYFKKN